MIAVRTIFLVLCLEFTLFASNFLLSHLISSTNGCEKSVAIAALTTFGFLSLWVLFTVFVALTFEATGFVFETVCAVLVCLATLGFAELLVLTGVSSISFSTFPLIVIVGTSCSSIFFSFLTSFKVLGSIKVASK